MPALRKMNMRRRAVLALGVVLTLGAAHDALAAEAKQSERVAHIGLITVGSQKLFTQFRVFDPFFRQLDKLGYTEGRNLVVDYRFAEGEPERLPALAQELVRLKVDVIVAGGPAAARAAKNATTTVPIVFTLVGDPVAEGLVDCLARPRGNVTGVTLASGIDTVGKRIQLLKEAAPSIKRIGVLWNPGNPSHAAIIPQLPAAAREAGVELRTFELRRPEDFESLFAAMRSDRVDGMLVLEDAVIALRAKDVADFVAQAGTPAIYGAAEFVRAGGLMSYQASFASVNEQAAIYVDKIIKGAKPSSLPVELPTKFELVINLNAAKAIQLAVPRELLLRADEVFP